MPLALYVYYRVSPQAADIARQRAMELFNRLEERFGVRGRLLTSCDDPDLLMEVYEGVDAGTDFESALASTAAAIGFDGLLRAGTMRKLERFRD